MANCQDLVNSVLALDATQQSILSELQELRAVVIETKESIIKVEKHLGFRLPARGYWTEALKSIVESIITAGDVVAERVAQHTQLSSGSSDIPTSDIPDVPVLDAALDVDTPGTS